MKKKKFSLRKRTILFSVGFSAIIGLSAILIFYRGIQDVIKSQYGARSVDIASLVAQELDAELVLPVQRAVREIYDGIDHKVMSDQWGTPEFEDYCSHFTPVAKMPEYQALLADLKRMQNVVDVNCLYLVWLDAENSCYIYLVDADNAEPCPIGCIDPTYDTSAMSPEHPEAGARPNITNTPEYGWIICTGMPIFDDQNNVVALATLDIYMNTIVEQERRFLVYSSVAFLVVTVIFCLIIIWLVNRHIVKPINKLSNAAWQYAANRKIFSELNIRRDDEIGILADSMVRMESDINGYIVNLEKTTKDLISAREHAEQLDRVANVDSMTKVFNKRAFALDAQRLNESDHPFCIVMIDMNNLKTINDTYGHEKGDVSIKTLTQAVCLAFPHSAIYRVGGDEFIAILEDDDFEARKELIRLLNEVFRKNLENDALPPWERVTAAVGSADFVPGSGDHVGSLLQKADEAMYERKKLMKIAMK